MCGLVAFFSPERPFDGAFLDRVEQDIVHRGPDAGGRCVEPGFALVHRRLSIIDPRAAADQPMHAPDGSETLIYNGEIYNHRALRHELEAAGAEFRTNSDSEVILIGYRYWGDDLVRRLQGMFAFVLVDRRRNVAVAARDGFGIKPLYLRNAGGTVGLASEMRPLLRLGAAEPDPAALHELIEFGWAAGDRSNLAGIERVRPGTILTVDLGSGTLTRRKYFDVRDTIDPTQDTAGSTESLLDEIDQTLRQSVSDHLMSDVGYTVQLSGGVDSSLIAAYGAELSPDQLRTFGIDLVGIKENERAWRDKVATACHLDHHEVAMDGRTFAEHLPRAVRHMEGPVPHGGCVLLMALCDEIRKASKIVLTGEGADEFFGGYERFGSWKKLARQERLSRILPTGLLPNRPPFLAVRSLAGRDAAVRSAIYGDTTPLQELFPDIPAVPTLRDESSARFHDFRSRLLAVDQTVYLESLLLRQDKMAMAASVEARVPFVHLPLARLVNRIPHHLRIPGGETKPLLKRVAERRLPVDVVRRRKIGLLLPYADWCRDDRALAPFVDDLTAESGGLSGIADRRRLARFVQRFRDGGAAERRQMFRLINMDLWLRSLKEEQVRTGAAA